jgi:4-amino-4-deoxy-L-arabinose transferase-like glycosyltransferase
VKRRLVDLLFLGGLAIYTLAGMPLATFHGDEPMQIYMSRDFETAFIARQPLELMTAPPYFIDTDAHLRILNGSVNRYTIGLARALAGIDAEALPPRPGWDWGLSYDDNVASGRLPSNELLVTGRLPSTLFFTASIVVVFLLARLLCGASLPGLAAAYLITAIYALHPALLLNARRALQEGAMLFFGLLTVLTAAVIAQRRALEQPLHPSVWVGLSLAGGLTLASKHSGAVFVAGAFGWLIAAELTRCRPRACATLAAALTLSGLAALAAFIALSPALWNDPPARLADLLAVRAELLEIQTISDPGAPLSIDQRLAAIAAEPFLRPPMHFEAWFWADYPAIRAEIDRYMASPLSGFQFASLGGLPGVVLSGLAVVGVIGQALTLIRGDRPARAAAAGLLVWLAVMAAALVTNPLPWQRYYLPLLPIAALLAGLGALELWQQGAKRLQQ